MLLGHRISDLITSRGGTGHEHVVEPPEAPAAAQRLQNRASISMGKIPLSFYPGRSDEARRRSGEGLVETGPHLHPNCGQRRNGDVQG